MNLSDIAMLVSLAIVFRGIFYDKRYKQILCVFIAGLVFLLAIKLASIGT